MVIGLTGGVATGKSVVSAELRRLGAHVVDADVIAREVVEPGAPAYAQIVAEFGPGVVRSDGTLDRPAIAALVFSDPERLKRLNEITHPPIRRKIRDEVARIERGHPGALIVVDAALLIENGLYLEMSRVVVVTASDERQVERIAQRDGLGANEAKRRIAAQMPVAEKALLADHVIDNDGEIDHTIKQTRALYAELTK